MDVMSSNDTVQDPPASGFDATMAAPDTALERTLAAQGAVTVTPESLRSTRRSVLPRVSAIGEDLQLVHQDCERYKKVAHLGAGGMGEVERAEDVDIGRSVAIKRLLPEASSASNVVRFVQEVRIVGSLEHPNVVPVHDVGLDEQGRYFFVMKYVDGDSLEKVIERLQAGDPETHRQWTIDRRVEVFISVLRALEYAHSNNIIHRDIKPANVMVGRYGEVWLMDWGIAKRVDQVEQRSTPSLEEETKDSAASIRTTRKGALVGTPAYMAPEQARSDLGRVDQRSDLYAACVMLHELITLRHYLDEYGDSLPKMLEAIQTHEPGFLELLRVHEAQSFIPAELVHFIQKGLQKKPEDRFQSASEMIQSLVDMREGKVRIQCHATFTKRVARELGRFVDRHPHVAFMGLVAGAVAFGGSLVGIAAHFL